MSRESEILENCALSLESKLFMLSSPVSPMSIDLEPLFKMAQNWRNQAEELKKEKS